MKIIGLSRIRNESEIIQDTLDHMSTFCDEVYIYDDTSTDDTVEICDKHPIVKGIIRGAVWDTNRERAEYQNRQAVLDLARRSSQLKSDDWFVYMDADERLEFDINYFKKCSNSIDGVKMTLFDFYITKDDVDKNYKEREWMGPEYRVILFMFKNGSAAGYSIPDQREVTLKGYPTVITTGYVKHYGKSISIQQWEDTCEYYSKNFPKYATKWRNRKGKAIHTKSDFGRTLIKWKDKNDLTKIIRI